MGADFKMAWPVECIMRIPGKQATDSAVWLFAILNYLYCDLIGLMDPALLKGYLAGRVAGMDITQGFLLSASLLMEIPIAMVLLSRLLRRGLRLPVLVPLVCSGRCSIPHSPCRACERFFVVKALSAAFPPKELLAQFMLCTCQGRIPCR
jgi:hypothetical protein